MKSSAAPVAPPLGGAVGGSARARRASVVRLALVAFALLVVPAMLAVANLSDQGGGRAILASMVAALLTALLVGGRATLMRPSHLAFLGLFGMLALATLLVWPRDGFPPFYTAATGLASCFIWCSVYLIVHAAVQAPAEARLALLILDAGAIAVPATVFLSYLGPEYLGFEFGEIQVAADAVRAFGPFGDNVGFALVLFAARSAVRRRWLGLALNTVAILLTGTRGAMVTLGVALAWLGLTLVRGHRRRRLAAVLVVLWAGMSAALFLASPYGDTALGRLALLLSGGDVLTQRRAAATVGLRIVLDNPVLGLGYLGVNRVAEEYGAADYVHNDPEQARGLFTAQNQYLEVATDAGLLGLAAFVLFVVVLWRGLRPGGAGLPQTDDVLAIRAFLIGMLVGNLGSVWMLHLSIAGYCFFAAAGLAERLVGRPASERAASRARPARS